MVEWKRKVQWLEETSMSELNGFVEKILAACPNGGEEALLAVLLKRLQSKYTSDEQVEVFDEKGTYLGYFQPAFDDSNLPEYPEFIEALRRQEADLPDKPGIPGDQFCAEQQQRIEELREQLARESAPTERSA
jgi:hypothetical protein